MQIHEITSRRLDEGVLGALGSIAKAAGTKFVASTTGVDLTGAASGDPLARSKAAMAINTQLATQLGQQLNQVWGQVTQNFMASHKDAAGNPPPLTSLKTAAPADAAKLKQELSQMVIDATKVGKPLDQWAASINSGDPKDANRAKIAVNKVKVLVDGIWNDAVESTDTTGRVRASHFAELGQLIATIQNINEFVVNKNKDQESNPNELKVTFDARTGLPLINGQPYNKADPAHQKAYAAFQKAGGAAT